VSHAEFSVFVPGLPKGQPRSRSMGYISRKTGKPTSRVYDPGTAQTWREDVRAAVRPIAERTGTIVGPVKLVLVFYFPRPKMHFKRSGELREPIPVAVVRKPDFDNAAKVIADAMTDVAAWMDDAQLADVRIVKLYGDKPGCEIRWEEIPC